MQDRLARMTASIGEFSRGFGRAGRDGQVIELPGVVASLAAADMPPPAGVHAQRAGDLELFDRVLAAAYDFPPGVFPYCFPRLLDEFHCYVASHEGDPGCALACVYRDGDCGFTLVGTDPAARRRGLAAALMRLAIADAAAAGCTTTTLQATQMGRPLYRGLGYEELGEMRLWEHRSRC